MIFQPQNVMGPANRGNVIQQLAQGAAQNVMRRQRMRALLANTAGQAGQAKAAGGNAAIPFRNSTMGHAMGVRAATFRPGPGVGGPGPIGGAVGGGAMNAMYADPGAMDLPSLPNAADPSQSASSTQPSPAAGPGNPGMGGVPSSVYNPTPGGGSQDATPFYGGGSGGGWGTGGTDVVPLVQNGLIPIGGGMYYDPATDAIHGAPSR